MMPSTQPRGLLKNFRRKSSANALDFPQQDAPQQSSFRVLERPDKADAQNRASTVLNDRPSTSPLQFHTKSSDNLGTLLNSNRTTNSNSSGYYDTSGSSARHSSSSTLPSSLEAEQDDGGELFPIRKQKTAPALPDVSSPEPPPPSFTARAGRAFSFGLGKGKSSSSPPVAVPYSSTTSRLPPSTTLAQPARPAPALPTPPEGSHSEASTRDRTLTSSSYASTAKPPQINSALGSPDFGGDFENMFDHLQKENANPHPLPQLPHAVRKAQSANFDRPDSPVDLLQLPARTSSRAPATPSQAHLDRPTNPDQRRYSWGSKRSSEELVSGDSSAYNSPSSELFPASTKPTGAAALTSLAGMRGYEALPIRQVSPDQRDLRDSPTSQSGFLSALSNRPSSTSPVDGIMTTPSRPALERMSPNVDRASNSPLWASPTVTSPQAGSAYGNDTANSTPRPNRSILKTDAGFLYESPTGPEKKFISPAKQRVAPQAATPKKMTSAQFAQAQKSNTNLSIKDDDEKSEGSDNEELDDEDEVEKQKKIAAQRRRQEATMSVYRQQMKKVAGGTGDTLSGLPSQGARPSLERSSLSNLVIPNFSFNGGSSPGADGAIDEEDDDVPLGILQAHGFPSKTRPPSQLGGAQSTYAASAAGDTPGALPAFARKLPQDPYFGAGLVNPTNRQSLAYGGSGASVYGAPASGPPGGLVGVIASEEKARAGRRGSPNPVTGGYNAPLPTNIQGQSPQMPAYGRSMSMASLAGPQMGMGMGMGMDQNGFGQMSQEQATLTTQQQMAHLMQMQTQMMQQMMALQAQAGQMGFQLPMQNQGMQNMPGFSAQSMAGQQPPSGLPNGRPPSMIGQGRSMSMLSPPSNWGGDMQHQRSSTMLSQPGGQYAGSVFGMNMNGPGAGYTPSIAPSERSNIGMPSRYRPVSIIDGGIQNPADRRSKTMTTTSYNPHTMAGAPMPARTPSPLADNVAATATTTKPKSTIRIIDKIRGAPKSSLFRSGSKSDTPEDEEDTAGWAQMAKKREAMRQRRANKAQKNDGQEALADLYQGLDD